ncbi:MAG: hypothetical protein ABF261_04840 [Candidatus Arcticimaribacter sp.]
MKIKRVSYRVYRSINARLNDIEYDGYVNGFFSLMVQIYLFLLKEYMFRLEKKHNFNRGTFNYAQIGHIGADALSINDSDGMVTGNIYLALGGSIDVVGGSDYSSFAQLGHGGLHAIATYIGKYLLLTPNVRLSLRSIGNGYSRLGND